MLAYTFVGYGALVTLLARWWPRRSALPIAHLPAVRVILVVCNEAARIAGRLQNLLASDYPSEKLTILVVSDGSTDATVARAQAVAGSRVQILNVPERRGKAAGLNLAMTRGSSELICFADARQRFETDTISRLVTHFADRSIGAVSGALEIEPSATGAGDGISAYWRYEKSIRTAESVLGSCIGCTGAVYAIRSGLFEPISEDTILDDVVIPMQIAVRGYRVIHDPEAVAYDPQPLDPETETVRKRRTLAGNFQMLFRHPSWLLPWRNRLWWQLISHKYLRIAAPLVLACVLAANIVLLPAPLYVCTLAVQLAFYGCAALGLGRPDWRFRAFTLPAGFLFLNLTTVRGFWHYLRGSDLHRWKGAAPGGSGF